MSNPVVLKGNKDGLAIYFDEGLTMDEIKNTIEQMEFGCNRGEFTKPLIISLEGKRLSHSEKIEILESLKKKGISILGDTDKTKSGRIKDDSLNKYNLLSDEGLFLIGNVSNGEIVEAKDSLVIVGNVEKGAKIYSHKNIVVVGRIEGYVQAGCKGDKRAFVYSMISGRNL